MMEEEEDGSLYQDERIMPSFFDLKRKTIASLYGIDICTDEENLQLLKDKSPKGSVDEPIREMVDLINSFAQYTTLSSCSGRIALFDPHYQHTANTSATTTSKSTSGSGKGSGGWLLSCHSTITLSTLEEALQVALDSINNEDGRLVLFKLEPMLLHVAAASVEHGRLLLKMALDLGFRESGMIYTHKRITIAIRSHSLSMEVPISPTSPPPTSYLQTLVQEANRRFQLNQQKLEQFHSNIQQLQSPTTNDITHLHTPSTPATNLSGNAIKSMNISSVKDLPPLNLWSHASVILPNKKKHDNFEVLIFGGYGSGPDGNHKSACRSNKIYSLSRKNGIWDTHWIDQTPATPQTMEDKKNSLKEMKNGWTFSSCEFPSRQDLAACCLSLPTKNTDNDDNDVVLLFGGRSSPAHATNELLVYSPSMKQVWKPYDVRGTKPSPRWGHSFQLLRSNQAICIGGRNSNEVFSTLHILSIFHPYFQWEQIVLQSDIPRFHHTTSIFSTINDDQTNIIIFGGLRNIQNLSFLSSTNSHKHQDDDNLQSSMIHITLTKKNHNKDKDNNEQTNYSYHAEISKDEWIDLDDRMMVPYTFGSATTSTWTKNNNNMIIMTSGGIECHTNGKMKEEVVPSLSLYQLNHNEKKKMQRIPIEYNKKNDDDAVMDFGSLVHHSMECISSSSNNHELYLILLGGGVDSFAFGPMFARSYCLSLTTTQTYQNNNNHASTTTRDGVSKMVMRNTTPSSRMAQPINSGSNSKQKHYRPVLFVNKCHAKSLKLELEQQHPKNKYLDTSYRMVPAVNDNDDGDDNDWKQYIAVPVTPLCIQDYSSDNGDAPTKWKSFVIKTGMQYVPFSTKVMGSGQRRKRRT